MDYVQAAAYIEEIPKFTVKHTTAHTREFIKRLGSPEQRMKILHVAGTNGKGSVCAYLQAVLLAEGKSVGLFTSPHLIALNERICVNGEQITDEVFLEVFEKVKNVVDGMAADGIAHPSYFEFLFGMGMTAFAQSSTEYVILETGLGGRLDATNSVEKPLVTVITSISLDHTAILGETIEEIAAEKAGIIKEGVPVFFDGGDPRAAEVIRAAACYMHADCREISKNAFEIREIGDKHIDFSRLNAYDEDITWKLAGRALYQVDNAVLAISAAEFVLQGEEVHKEQWQQALYQLRWEGRMEEIAPGILVDGAHNPGGVEAFVDSVQAGMFRIEEEDRLPVILFSAVSDKEYETMIAYLCRNLPAKAYVVTEIEDKRKVPVQELSAVFRKYTDREVVAEPVLGQAFQAVMDRKGEDGMVFCLGSLYLVGMVKRLLDRRQEDA